MATLALVTTQQLIDHLLGPDTFRAPMPQDTIDVVVHAGNRVQYSLYEQVTSFHRARDQVACFPFT